MALPVCPPPYIFDKYRDRTESSRLVRWIASRWSVLTSGRETGHLLLKPSGVSGRRTVRQMYVPGPSFLFACSLGARPLEKGARKVMECS